jgi:hypothetical protein
VNDPRLEQREPSLASASEGFGDQRAFVNWDGGRSREDDRSMPMSECPIFTVMHVPEVPMRGCAGENPAYPHRQLRITCILRTGLPLIGMTASPG